MVLEDEKMREFLEKKEKGTLTIQRIRQNCGTVEMTGQARGVKTDDAPSDGLLHHGKGVRVKNCELLCYLACDPGDADNVEEALFSGSGSRRKEASARNVWVLRKHDDGEFLPSPTGGSGDDDIVCCGDQLALSTTDAIAAQPFYLSSRPVDWSHFSRVSRKQLVLITQEKLFKAMWRIDSVARDSSYDLEGEPGRLGKPVFIKHCSTGSPLACHDAQILNDHGSEYELVAAREPGKKMIWRFTTRESFAGNSQ
jgi:hypothetical protein